MKLVAPQRILGPRTFFACVVLIDLLLILSIDMYAPALPSMQREFGVTEAHLNSTMFAFFVSSAVGVVLAGPLSDRFGRKPVLLAACALFTASSAGCMAAPSVEALVAFRVGEALGYGAVATIETALVKDAYADNDLKIAMTSVQSLIIIGPAAAPFLGSLMLAIGGWREIFVLLTAGGVVSFALGCLITETNPQNARSGTGVVESLRIMARDSRQLLKQRSFTSFSLYMGVAGVPYFAFIAVVSYILLDFFGTTYLEYSVIYAAACLVSIAAPFVYIALSKRLSVGRIAEACIGLVAATTALMALVGAASPWLFLLAFVPYALAEGIVRPMAFVVLLDQPPERVGSASSFANFAYSIITSLATVLATLPWSNFVSGLTVLCAGSALVMAGLYLVGMRVLKR